MQEIRISDTESLLNHFNRLPNNYIYRGHANAEWPLQSSLERVIGAKWSSSETKKYEDYSLDVFRAKFHLYDRENIRPDSKLAWLSVMQHYGVPTRLVDFTESPYVALYFALEAYHPSTKVDLAVFALDYTAIMDASIAHITAEDPSFTETRKTVYPKQDKIFDETVDRFAYDIAWVTEPKHHNERLDRQGGCFLVSGNGDRRIADVLDLSLYGTCEFVKYIIDHRLYSGIFALLRKMNVTSRSLYGDLDGLARSIRMQLQVYSAPDP
jgi:FRG domain